MNKRRCVSDEFIPKLAMNRVGNYPSIEGRIDPFFGAVFDFYWNIPISKEECVNENIKVNEKESRTR